MDDEDTLREVDWRITSSLAPDRAVTRRVLAASMSEGKGSSAWRRGLETSVLAGSLAALAAVIYLNRPAVESAASTHVTIVGEGSSIVVLRANGTRWGFAGDAAPASLQGGYVIAVHRREPR